MEKLKFMNNISLFGLLFLLGISLGSCKSEYQQYVERERATGVEHDSLIMGMRMGQTKAEFFEMCWQLNKEKMVSNGSGANVRYVTDRDSLGNNTADSKEMLFYGLFDEEDVMHGMRMKYSYTAWAPWNRDKQPDSLLARLKPIYLQKYPGNDFIEINLKESEHPALVKIDGNRQILMYIKNKRDVMVKIEDLKHKYK